MKINEFSEEEVKETKTQINEKIEENEPPSINPFTNALNICQFGNAGLSKAGTEYYKGIQDELNQERIGFKVDTRVLNINNTTVIVYYAANSAVALIMEETFSTLNNEIPASIIPLVNKTIKETVPNIKIVLNTIIVTKDEYDRREQMALWIYNLLTIRVHADVFKSAKLKDMKNKTINIEMFDRAYNQYANTCPVTPARNDLTLMVTMSEPAQNLNLGFDQKPQKTSRVLGFATGYVDIVYNPKYGIYADGTQKKFLPIVRITDIVPAIPDITSLTYLYAVITDSLIVKKQWKAQFVNFLNGVNVGAVAGIRPDKDGNEKLYQVQNMNDFEEFMFKWFAEPALCIDISAGRPMVPGLGKLVSDDHSSIIEEFCRFTGDEYDSSVVKIGDVAFKEFGGLINYEGQMRDSRVIDYLALAPKFAKSSNNLNMIDFLLKKSDRPHETLKAISNTIAEVKPLYVHQSVALSPTFLKKISKSVSEKLSFNTISVANNTGLDLSGLANQSSGFSKINPLSSIGNNTVSFGDNISFFDM